MHFSTRYDRLFASAGLPPPSQERSDAPDRLEQSRILNKRYSCAGVPGFRHQLIG
jgi:hypothetical protein